MTAAKSAGRLEFCFFNLICCFLLFSRCGCLSSLIALPNKHLLRPDFVRKNGVLVEENAQRNYVRRYPQRGSFKILNPEVQIREILSPEKPIW